MKRPALSFSFFVKKTCTLSKANWSYAHFVRFSRKNHDFVRNGPFSKKHCSQGHTWSKKFHSLKKQGAVRSLFRIFHENPPSVMPIFCQKNVNSIETIIYNGPKMSLGCHFFQLFTKYSLLSCQYFVKKRPFSK